MMNFTVILKEVPYNRLKNLKEVLNQSKPDSMNVEASINYDLSYVTIDIESEESIKVFALSHIVDLIDYAGIGDFVQEIGVD